MEAMQQGRAVSGRGGPGSTMAVPLRVRGQIIGVLDAYKPAGTGKWTDEEIALFQELVDQLGMALDSARLYQEAQRRAAEDRLVGEITARLRATMDVDTVLQTAVQEMGSALGIEKVELRLRNPRSGDGQGQLHEAKRADATEEDRHGGVD